MQEQQNYSVAVLVRRLSHPRDPPGQKSVYITPGDHRDQVYRLLTFKDFPHDNVNPCILAKNGFYFTGYKDRAKCFSCGVAIEEWKPGSDKSFLQLHLSNCPMRKRRNEFLEKYQRNQSPDNQNNTGSITSNNSNSLTRISTDGDMLKNSTSRGHPPVSFVTTSSSTHNHQFIPVSSSSHSTTTLNANSITASIPQGNVRAFPCLHPINPHMSNQDNRLRTFADRATNWPAHRITASPREIVDAGFFYLGERDRVKCWYCNGGLQNWERDDDPWEEHAKWFPLCEYLLHRKGVRYVHEIISRTQNLKRSSLYNPANVQFPNTVMKMNSVVGSASVRSTPAVTTGPEMIDLRERMNDLQRKVDQDMETFDLVKQAHLMGFENEVIKEVLKNQYETCGVGFSSFKALIDALLRYESEENFQEPTEKPVLAIGANSSERLTFFGASELKQLVESRKCIICHRKDAREAFVSCGHLVLCSKCGINLNECPVCPLSINERNDSRGRARIVDLWARNSNVYVLREWFQRRNFQTNHIILPDQQSHNACGYIAAKAAIAFYQSNDWFNEDIAQELLNPSIIEQYNLILGFHDKNGRFLTDNQILMILHHHSHSNGVPWLDAINPLNLFLTACERNIAEERQRCKRLHIFIVNTTPHYGRLQTTATGDHWIVVAYEVF